MFLCKFICFCVLFTYLTLPYCVMGLPRWFIGQEMTVQSLSPEEALETDMAAAPTFLPGKALDRGVWWAALHGVSESRM